MKDHRATGMDCATVPHNDLEGQKVGIKSFYSLQSHCFIDEEKTKGASKVFHKILPPSTKRDWVQNAVAIISKLSGMAVVQRNNAIKQVPC
uniref:Uncharacterized protein n=1 Tax=Amphimedon queenslandica TaxID=400682 RepID=A0A1X7UWQ4_AMPQE